MKTPDYTNEPPEQESPDQEKQSNVIPQSTDVYLTKLKSTDPYLAKSFLDILDGGNWLAIIGIIISFGTQNHFMKPLDPNVIQMFMIGYSMFLIYLIFNCMGSLRQKIEITPCIYSGSFWVLKVSAIIMICFMISIYGMKGFIFMIPSLFFGIIGLLICLKQTWDALTLIGEGKQVYYRE